MTNNSGLPKYDAETAFLSGCTYAALVPVSKLEEARGMDARVASCRIYGIVRRPRVTLDPESLVTFGQKLSFDAISQRIDEDPIRANFEMDLLEGFSVDSKFPNRTLRVFGQDGAMAGEVPVSFQITEALREHDYGARLKQKEIDDLFLDLEVLYIGKSDDENGVTNSRLISHSKLQFILAQHSDNQPQYDLFVLLMEFGSSSTLAVIDGKKGSAGEVASADHVYRAFTKGHVSNERIALTEAALIRYFQPYYNTHYMKSFPSTEHSSYSDYYNIDFNSVGVTLNAFEVLGCRLWSGSVGRNFLHEPFFSLNDESKRRAFLDIEALRAGEISEPQSFVGQSGDDDSLAASSRL